MAIYSMPKDLDISLTGKTLTASDLLDRNAHILPQCDIRIRGRTVQVICEEGQYKLGVGNHVYDLDMICEAPDDRARIPEPLLASVVVDAAIAKYWEECVGKETLE